MNIETRLKLEHLSETKELIRDAIQSKGQNVSDDDTFRSYAEKIGAIKTEPNLESLEVTENGTYTPSEGVDGFGNVKVNVPAPEIVLQDKTITENGTYTADSGFDGLGAVTVDVASSSGDSASGLLFEFGEYAPPNQYGQRWFTYKGELYAVTRINANNGNEVNIYKYVNGKWSTIISNGELLSFSNGGSWACIEFNGFIHMFGTESTNHYVFNGTTITKKTNLTKGAKAEGIFIVDNTLKLYSCKDGNVYAWNESTDTWTQEGTTIGGNYQYYYFATIGNDVYCAYSKDLYKYENGAKVKIATLSVSPKRLVSYNGCLYYFDNISNLSNGLFRAEWYKYDPLAGTETLLGYGAYGDTMHDLFFINNKLYHMFGRAGACINICQIQVAI